MSANANANPKASQQTPSTTEELMRLLETERIGRQETEALLRQKEAELLLTEERLEHELNERKQLETHLVQSEKMASLGQLAAGVAHEINNPIGFVMSNIGSLSEYLQTFKRVMTLQVSVIESFRNMDPRGAVQLIEELQLLEAQEDLSFIIDDVDALVSESEEGMTRVKEIVRDLKSFARVDEAEEQETDVNECIESALKIVWNELKYHCEVQKELSPVPRIKGYPGQLNQVFMNLMVNAAQAIAQGKETGELQVARGIISVKTLATPTQIVVEISDNGPGIPKKLLKDIFNPFFTTKPVGKGTGLGLSIAYGIIQKHQGHIEVKSETDPAVGTGTTFMITLPTQLPSQR